MNKKFLSFDVTAGILVLVLFSAGTLRGIDEYFALGHDGYNGGVLGASALTTLRFGFWQTHAGRYDYYIDPATPPSRTHVVVSHPQLYPLLLAAIWRITGVHEWSARLLSVFFSLGTLIALWMCGREILGVGYSWIAPLFAALMPLFQYYSRLCSQETPAVFFATLAFALYLRASRNRNGYHAAGLAMALVIVVGSQIDWFVYVIAAVIAVHGSLLWLFERKREYLFLAALSAAALISGLGLFFLHAWIADAPLSVLWERAAQRSGMSSSTVSFSLPEFYTTLRDRLLMGVGLPLLVLCLCAVPLQLLEVKLRSDRTKLLWILPIGAIVFLGVLRQGTFVHDYFLICAVPGFAILSAYAVTTALKLAARVRVQLPILISCVLIGFLAFSMLPRREWYFAQKHGITELRIAEAVQNSTPATTPVYMTGVPGDLLPQLQFTMRRPVHISQNDERLLEVAGGGNPVVLIVNRRFTKPEVLKSIFVKYRPVCIEDYLIASVPTGNFGAKYAQFVENRKSYVDSGHRNGLRVLVSSDPYTILGFAIDCGITRITENFTNQVGPGGRLRVFDNAWWMGSAMQYYNIYPFCQGPLHNALLKAEVSAIIDSLLYVKKAGIYELVIDTTGAATLELDRIIRLRVSKGRKSASMPLDEGWHLFSLKYSGNGNSSDFLKIEWSRAGTKSAAFAADDVHSSAATEQISLSLNEMLSMNTGKDQ